MNLFYLSIAKHALISLFFEPLIFFYIGIEEPKQQEKLTILFLKKEINRALNSKSIHKLVRIDQCAPVYDYIIHKLVRIAQCAPLFDCIIHKLVRINHSAPVYDFSIHKLVHIGQCTPVYD